MLTVTVDTSAVDEPKRARMEEVCREAGIEANFALTTVAGRELEGTDILAPPAEVVETGVWGESRWGQFRWGGPIRETFVLDESRLDEGALGADDSQTRLDTILRILGSGSFPPLGQREHLSLGQRRQLRDAMSLEAHWRDGRDVFVTEDGDFIDHGRREQLEALCSTRIRRVGEFCEYVRGLHDGD